jgi:hypothetical protein
MLIRKLIGRESRSSREIISWRKITGNITIEFLEAAVERMFTADEVSGVVDLAKLKELKHRNLNFRDSVFCSCSAQSLWL